jgi:1,4-alpha-glucan branching enzyme
MAKKNNTKNADTDTSNGRIQTFSFTAPAATSVQLVGGFTHWEQKPISMQRAADGIWRTTVALTPGTHQYRFLVDGEWQDDPECRLRVSNPFGSEDAIREVA